MSESRSLKALFNTLAILPAIARINDEDHYFSQVFIGTGLGFLAARSVAKTNAQRVGEAKLGNAVSFVPVVLPDGGYGFSLRKHL